MNPSSNTSAAIAAMIAFSTNAAGPILRNASKADPIGKSETCLRPVLRALLIGSVAHPVLACGQLIAQSAPVRLGRKAPYLINLCKILCTPRKKDVSPKPVLVPASNRKAESRHPRGTPFRTGPGKFASRLAQSQRRGPVPRQIKKYAFADRQNSRRRVPVPVLPVDDLHSAQPTARSHPPSAVIVEERFAFWNDTMVVGSSAAHRERTPLRQLSRHPHEHFSRIRSRALVGTSCHARLPVRCPLRGQAHTFTMVCTGEIKEIAVHPHVQLVLRLLPQGKQARVRLCTHGIEGQNPLKLPLGFLCVIGCLQRARVGRAQIGALGIEFHGAIQRPERILPP